MTDNELENIIKRISAYTGLGNLDKLTFYKKDGKFHFKLFSSKLYLPKDISKALDSGYDNHLYSEPNNYEEIKDSLSDIIEDISIDTNDGYIDIVPVDQKMVVVVNDSYIKPFNKKKLLVDDIVLMPKTSSLNEQFLQETFGYHEILHEDEADEGQSGGNESSDADSSSQESQEENNSTEETQDNAKSANPLVLVVSSLRMPLSTDAMKTSFSNLMQMLQKGEGNLSKVTKDLEQGAQFMIGFADYDASAEPKGDWLVQSYVRLSGIDNNANSHGVFFNTHALEAIKEGLGQDVFKNSQIQILSYKTIAGIKKNYSQIDLVYGAGSEGDLATAELPKEDNDQFKVFKLDDISQLDTHCGQTTLTALQEKFIQAYNKFNENYVKKGAFDPELTSTDASDKANNASDVKNISSQSQENDTTSNNQDNSNANSQQTQATNQQADTSASSQNAANTANNNLGEHSIRMNRSWWLKEDEDVNAAGQSTSTGTTSTNTTSSDGTKEADSNAPLFLSKRATAKRAYADFLSVIDTVGKKTSNLITLIAKNLYWAPGFANDKDKFNGINNIAQANEEKRSRSSSTDFSVNWSGGVSRDEEKAKTKFGLKKAGINLSNDKEKSEEEDLSQKFGIYCCTDEAGVNGDIAAIWPDCVNVTPPDPEEQEENKEKQEEAAKIDDESANVDEGGETASNVSEGAEEASNESSDASVEQA